MQEVVYIIFSKLANKNFKYFSYLKFMNFSYS